jgi:phosphoserine phosphatase
MDNPLPSWNAGAAKTAILDFVDRVTDEGGGDYVAPADRIAVFDNDTLWCERPAYAQALFLLERLHEQATAYPDLAAQPVVQALLAGDLEAAAQHGPEAVAGVIVRTHASLTAEEFAATAAQWLAESRHPRYGTRLGELTYVPMLELLHLLRSRDIRVFVVTGGGVEFTRAVSEELYGVPPDDVVGSAVQVSFERRDGRVVLVRQPALVGSANGGPPKPINIQAHIGRRPILAAGNSAGDRAMLEDAQTGDLPSLCLVVNHDDAEREYAYTGTAATSPDAEPILETASQFGSTVVSMRGDWNHMFPVSNAP